ncbi:Putative zinc-finger [Moorella glycerini]|uniref:Anti-sigma-W factor RsiW n=1 Tax=Neomoorella stamsii TaxID=1266720 RepID=A0A9X7J4W1_9FIRM|nr:MULTISPECIES: zf-HC2 domain-containing protein [Moorella]PRR75583.1 hypothetical protein MOST_07590 [Moorella stamsii]CEP66439.1 Putative zinc-finger [Moorella glycerini]
MNCSQYRELLSPYLDGVLAATQRRAVENHLRLCNSCREELEALRQTVNLLQAWSEEELDLPAGFEERLRSRLEAACRPWYRRLPQRWLSLAVAAAIVVAVAITAYADYFHFLHPFQVREAAPTVTQGEQGQVKALQAPVVPAPARDFSMIVTDQENKPPAPAITPSQEESRPAQPQRRQTAKPPKPQPVFNSMERNPVAQASTNVNSRGQNLDAALGENLQVGEGQKLPGEQVTGPEDKQAQKQITPGVNRPEVNKEKNEATLDARMSSHNNIESAGINQSLTVPAKVYKEPALTGIPEVLSRPPLP